MIKWATLLVLSKASTSTNPLGRQLVAVKSDHDAGADDRADHHLLTGVMAALISGKQKIDQRKTMQNWNWRAPQELHFGRAHIIAFSHNNKPSICAFSTWSTSGYFETLQVYSLQQSKTIPVWAKRHCETGIQRNNFDVGDGPEVHFLKFFIAPPPILKIFPKIIFSGRHPLLAWWIL